MINETLNNTLKEIFANGSYTDEQEQEISLFIDGIIKDELKSEVLN